MAIASRFGPFTKIRNPANFGLFTTQSALNSPGDGCQKRQLSGQVRTRQLVSSGIALVICHACAKGSLDHLVSGSEQSLSPVRRERLPHLEVDERD